MLTLHSTVHTVCTVHTFCVLYRDLSAGVCSITYSTVLIPIATQLTCHNIQYWIVLGTVLVLPSPVGTVEYQYQYQGYIRSLIL